MKHTDLYHHHHHYKQDGVLNYAKLDDDDHLLEKEGDIVAKNNFDDSEIIDHDLYWHCQPANIRLPLELFLKIKMMISNDIIKKTIPPSPSQQIIIVSELKVSILYLLPLRLISRIWGWFNGLVLPIWARVPIYRWYAATFGCNLDEMEQQDLTQFANLSQFFRRSLCPGVRPIGSAPIVSPADGRVIQLEQISDNSWSVGNSDGEKYVGSVKGIHYSVANFLGPNCRPTVLQPGNRLYSCVIYLAPGDYHRFHSPTKWIVKSRRHFSGRLFSVKPSFVAQVPDLFAINERVVYFGDWKHGFFSMTAVGATNVGSINVYFDPVNNDILVNFFSIIILMLLKKPKTGITNQQIYTSRKI